MAVIGLIGPHAIGKTTAVYRWLEQYSGKLLGVIADNQWEARSREDRTRVREWKGTVEQKRELVQQHMIQPGISVIDSVRTTNVAYFRPIDPVIIVVCSWKVMDRVLRARCVKNNKKFNEAYWTEWKLGYESQRRYLNFAQKSLHPEQYKIFEIEDQARDWSAVDDYFQKVFIRLWNGRKRK